MSRLVKKLNALKMNFLLKYLVVGVGYHFSSLYSLTSGQDLSPNNYNSDKKGIAYITGASNITDGKIEINRWTINPKSTAHFGDLLFTCKPKGTVGKMAFLNVEKAHIRQIIWHIFTL